MVHQHFMLIPALTVWENMILGMRDAPFLTDRRGIISKIYELSGSYSIPVDPSAEVWTLSIGERQRVEILKMLYRGTRVLILDEPTSVLTPQEVRDFFGTLARMREAGHGIVLISHKIEEILSISDRMTVLRKGERVATVDAGEATRESLARMMVGRELRVLEKREPGGVHPVVLSCKGLSARNDRGARWLGGVSFDIREGEILGVAGVAGNAQGELCEVLSGLRRLDKGEIVLKGENIGGGGPREFIKRGVSYIPVDRKGTGLVANMNLTENIALKRYWKPPASYGAFLLDWKYLSKLATDLMSAYDVQAPPPLSPVRVLSGGNMQKLMLARELSDKPSVILAMHPVWGLDVGATEFVRERLLEERERGAGILMVSEDLDEMLTMADRIMVMARGRVMGVIDCPRDTSKEKIGLMMAGIPENSAVAAS
jgi:simple sugar transport system ATP-binding protein